MSKVIEFEAKKHIYELDNCAGCSEAITNEYIELGLPSPDNKVIKHIALCSKCSLVAENEGVI